MTEIYGRDLDLNLLRVFAVVAQAGSVTEAAAQLYLTQPAVSAAMRRLRAAVGEPLFTRSGRGLTLNERGARLFEAVRPHLSAIVEAALTPPRFDAHTSERTMRIGLSDTMEGWFLPKLLTRLTRVAPRMRVIALPVQFRTVQEALASRRVDCAVTVADELPPHVHRRPLFKTSFVCLYDPRRLRLKTPLSEKSYFAQEHVIVSYNGDLRGVVEDTLKKQRNVRLSVASFSHLGALVSGSRLVATVPEIVARHLKPHHPALATAPVPFRLASAYTELLWPAALDGDPACAFVRALIVELLEPKTSESKARN
jgi:LysR family transcriptional activator of mexEF-oprN operon